MLIHHTLNDPKGNGDARFYRLFNKARRGRALPCRREGRENGWWRDVLRLVVEFLDTLLGLLLTSRDGWLLSRRWCTAEKGLIA